MHFTCAARTDVGIVRSGNEDNYLMLADRGIFIVADGMGGHAAGEVASEMAVRITSHEIGSVRGLSDEEAGERVRDRDPRGQRRHLRAHALGARQAGHGHHRHRAGAACRSAT